MQNTLLDVCAWCAVRSCAEEFEDVEENKLIYTDLFRQYTQLVGEHTAHIILGGNGLTE